ncbi:hypothetical protein DCC39_10035 [Pueribacillus theae]|uniref:Uncharacterized protein n=1 Tax=Pueribacillus theae TaxID=2171751 RepID=A0A2U1K105_9BACI|nr:hypothetical protein DCC39_10035 [Pueribacillus theae]
MARPLAVIMKTGQKWNNGHEYLFIRASVGVSSYRNFTRKLSISMERGCHSRGEVKLARKQYSFQRRKHHHFING